jgi:hypothetical protein
VLERNQIAGLYCKAALYQILSDVKVGSYFSQTYRQIFDPIKSVTALCLCLKIKNSRNSLGHGWVDNDYIQLI